VIILILLRKPLKTKEFDDKRSKRKCLLNREGNSSPFQSWVDSLIAYTYDITVLSIINPILFEKPVQKN